MRTKCAKCGKITDTPFELKYDSMVFGYTLRLCEDCGREVMNHIMKEEAES